jgi:S1-C subfamily serine protease
MQVGRILIAASLVVVSTACAQPSTSPSSGGAPTSGSQAAASASQAASGGVNTSAKPSATAAAQPQAAASSSSSGSSPVASLVAGTAYAQAAPAGGTVEFATAIRQVAQQVRPAVVQITNLQQQQNPFVGATGATVPAGVGSGVIYDNQGHILTNNHVIAGSQQIQVSLSDKRSFNGTLVGADPQDDLAVVQIQGDNLPVAQLGDSSQLAVGDWVVAIGNALALPGGPTVTQGVVSALGRTVQEPGDTPNSQGPFLFNAIQTDAPINPGNSGGALVNLQGQVIGINTLVAGQAEPGVQAQGIGFAIAIATAKPIADQLVTTGHAVHAFIGISYGPLTPGLARQLGVTVQNGEVIGAVAQGSPAQQAGLRPGDVITAIGGQQITDESTLPEVLSQKQPGDQITLSIARGGQQQDVQITLAQTPNS